MSHRILNLRLTMSSRFSLKVKHNFVFLWKCYWKFTTRKSVSRFTELRMYIVCDLRTKFNIMGSSFSATIIRQCVYKNNLDRISTQIAPQLIGLSSSFCCSFFSGSDEKRFWNKKGEKRFPLIQWTMSKMRIKEDLKRIMAIAVHGNLIEKSLVFTTARP